MRRPINRNSSLQILVLINVLQAASSLLFAGEWDRQARPTADPISAASLFPWGADFRTPDEVGLKFEPVSFQNSQGTKLRAWYFPAAHSNKCILLCMGNSGNISLMLPYARFLQDAGFNALLFDYSGFGKSEGIASIVTLLNDTSAALEYLLTQRRLNTGDIGVLGISLGTIPALTIAADHPVGAVALEDVFVPESEIKRWLPRRQNLSTVEQFALRSIEALILPKVNPQRNAARLNCPLFLLHGVNDHLLTPRGTLEVAENAGGPKRIWLMRDTGHAPHSLEVNDREYAAQLTCFFRDAFAGDLKQPEVPFQTQSVDGLYEITASLQHTAAVNPNPEGAISLPDAEPLEIAFADRTGRYHFEQRMLRQGDSFSTTLNFRPTDVFAVKMHHTVAVDNDRWQTKKSDYSEALASFNECLQQVFQNERNSRIFVEDRGHYFYDQRFQKLLPQLSKEDVQSVLDQLQQPDEIPETLRPRYARLLARLQCWPDGKCTIAPDDRGLDCAELMLKYCPQNVITHYELGNARIELGFADSAVGDALYRLAKARLAAGRVEEARDLLRYHLQVLPNGVPTNLTEQRIQSIKSLNDLLSH